MLENVENGPLAEFISSARIRTYHKGQIIFYPEDVLSHLFVIKSGAISMHDYDDEGNQKILHIFGKQTLFPMVNFTSPSPTAAWFYSALTDVEVYLIPFKTLQAHMATPAGIECFNYILLQNQQEIHELLVRLRSFGKSTSTARVLSTLTFLATHHGKKRRGDWHRIALPTSQQLLADISGVTRESVNNAIKQLQTQGLVRYRSPLTVEVKMAT